MKQLIRRLLPAVACLGLLVGCAGTPVQLGSRIDGPLPNGESRTISAESCGFQLFLMIPIAVNGRLESAYEALQEQAGGDFITDVEVQERWGYRFVGTTYCTELRAKAIRRQ